MKKDISIMSGWYLKLLSIVTNDCTADKDVLNNVKVNSFLRSH